MAIIGAASLGSIKPFQGIAIFFPVQISTQTQTYIGFFILCWIYYYYYYSCKSLFIQERASDLCAFMHLFIYEQMVEKCVCMVLIG